MLLRIVSLASPKKVFHKPGCPYISKIHSDSKRTADMNLPRWQHYRPCKYCGGMRGWARIFHKRPDRQDKERGLDCYYDKKTDMVFIRSNVGFWKIYWQAKEQKYLLFHLNHFVPEVSPNKLMRWKFHRQGDVSPTPEFDSLISYISSHDKNKAIAMKDYRKLPQKTKKQQKIRKHYERKAKRDYYKRMNKLFEQIKTRK